jgi:pimeloyl-ACP methyl ester carboxylesterase
LFTPNSSNVFTSLIDERVRVEFEFAGPDRVSGLWWHREDSSRYAKKVFAPRVEPIEFTNGADTLRGELYLPPGTGPFPLLVQIHGSGKQTRHAGPWNTFFVRYGVAVLAYDKRGTGDSTGDFATAGYPDFADDVVAAVAFAKRHPAIITDRIGLHGSSEGGWIASMVAARLPELAFVIVRAGSGVSGADTYLHEVKNELKAQELSPDRYTAAVRFERTIQDLVADGRPLAAVNQYITTFRQSHAWYPEVFGEYAAMSPDRSTRSITYGESVKRRCYGFWPRTTRTSPSN